MLSFVFILILIIGFAKYFIYPNSVKQKGFYGILGLFLFMSIYWDIKYFDDMYNYQFMFNNIDSYSTDFMFTYLVTVANNIGWEFQDLYNFHIFIIGLFFTLFAIKFSNNIIFIVILICAYRYIDYGNQIRYYMGYFLVLNALYEYMVKDRKGIAVFLATLGILSHSSLIVICIIPFIRNFLLNLTLKRLIIINIILLISFSFLILIISSAFPQFIKYFIDDKGKSSIIGGVFELLPLILIIWLLFTNHYRILKSLPNILENSVYKFLYTLCIFSFLFISTGLVFRILAIRFVFSFSIVWISYLLFTLNLYKGSERSTQRIKILSVFLILILWFYYASLFILGSSYNLEEALKMLNIN
ncbi:hypothetical protein GCM10022216_32190 [Sphingobacterium kyonggiense]|uniref:EpsG-like glucosyltransferase n=1 Tax=Sphingobacterium kyonggiense TaxID=714075 RepID=A0ABP7Z3V4_9SPHI